MPPCSVLSTLLCFLFVLAAACKILAPRPGIESTPPAVGAVESWSLDYWTAREVSPDLLMNGCCFPTNFKGLGLEEIIFVNAVSFFSWKCGRLRAERGIRGVSAIWQQAWRSAWRQRHLGTSVWFDLFFPWSSVHSDGFSWGGSELWGQPGSGSIQPPSLNNRATLDKALWFS